MGIFFFICTLALLVYYLWAVFLDKPQKPIEIDELQEEVIEFTFDMPIKVSESFIKPVDSHNKQDSEEINSRINAPEVENTNKIVESAACPQSQSTSAEIEWFTFNMDKAVEKGKSIISSIYNSVNPSSVCSAEVEFFSFTQKDIVDLSRSGHNMFSHIPLG